MTGNPAVDAFLVALNLAIYGTLWLWAFGAYIRSIIK